MRAVLQITKSSSVCCEDKTVSSCGKGMCILLGIEADDTQREADKIIDKILKMRIFADENGKLNLSAIQVGAEILLISNFTLYANLSSRRPDFMRSMKYEPAKELYEYTLNKMQEKADEFKKDDEPGATVYPGVFGGHMEVNLVGDGPITIIVDTADF